MDNSSENNIEKSSEKDTENIADNNSDTVSEDIPENNTETGTESCTDEVTEASSEDDAKVTTEDNTDNVAEAVKKPEKPVRKPGFIRRGLKAKLFLSLSVNVFVALTLIFFSPLEVFLGNINEFWFSFGDIWWILGLISLATIAVATFVECLLPEKTAVAFNLVAFGLGLCCYIQSSFLNGKMGTLTGESDVYSSRTVYGNIAVWCAVFAVLVAGYVIFAKFGKKKFARTIVKFISLALVAMQATAMVSQLLTSKAEIASDSDRYLSDKGEFELSENGNVIVFIVDTCDSLFFEEMLDKYPGLIDNYDGFTYYDNATSTHSRTYPSIPYMLTNQMCYFDMSYKDYINDSYSKGTFLPEIASLGVDVGLYTDNQYIGIGSEKYVSNYENDTDSTVAVKGFVKQMSKVSLYRNTPYAVKQRFRYDKVEVNYNSVNTPNVCIANDDLNFYNRLTDKGLTTFDDTEGSFRFYHLWGAHPGAKFNENLERTEGSSHIESGAAAFKIIAKYIEEMKKIGVYKDSTIIITADHGSSVGSSEKNPLVIPGPARVVMLVKSAGNGNNTARTDDDTPYTVSSAPVCHADLFATIINAAGGDSTKYGKTIFDYSEDEERTRYYYNSALYTDEDGEVALREYEITGNSKDFANWKLTGRNWDINFSERAVSRHRLSEIK